MHDLLRYSLQAEPRKPARAERYYPHGEEHPQSKLKDIQREAIPKLIKEYGYTQAELSRRLGVSPQLIYRCNRRFGESE